MHVKNFKIFFFLSKNKSILFVGNSGAGKSTLTSKLIGKDLKTAALSNDQGVHTTSISSLYELENNTKIIDSPGMRDIEIDSYDSNQIILGFKEIHEASSYCKFNDCNHIKYSIFVKITKMFMYPSFTL